MGLLEGLNKMVGSIFVQLFDLHLDCILVTIICHTMYSKSFEGENFHSYKTKLSFAGKGSRFTCCQAKLGLGQRLKFDLQTFVIIKCTEGSCRLFVVHARATQVFCLSDKCLANFYQYLE